LPSSIYVAGWLVGRWSIGWFVGGRLGKWLVGGWLVSWLILIRQLVGLSVGGWLVCVCGRLVEGEKESCVSPNEVREIQRVKPINESRLKEFISSVL
jgi:hypothetical protein